MSKSKKIIDKTYVINLTRNDIWLVSDALRHFSSRDIKSVRDEKIKSLLKDFEGFEMKISNYLNEQKEK